MKHPEYNFLSMYYWIVCKHAVNQKQCGDICILRAHISFLAEMIEFQVLKYSVLWIPHPVRAAEKFYFQCHFSLNFSPRYSISNIFLLYHLLRIKKELLTTNDKEGLKRNKNVYGNTQRQRGWIDIIAERFSHSSLIDNGQIMMILRNSKWILIVSNYR